MLLLNYENSMLQVGIWSSKFTIKLSAEVCSFKGYSILSVKFYIEIFFSVRSMVTWQIASVVLKTKFLLVIPNFIPGRLFSGP